MSKKTPQPETTVKVKISVCPKEQHLYPDLKGKQVEMSEKDHKYVIETLKRFKKAQDILSKYYGYE